MLDSQDPNYNVLEIYCVQSRITLQHTTLVLHNTKLILVACTIQLHKIIAGKYNVTVDQEIFAVKKFSPVA